jgi:DNA polymerase III epsilon subunit-like protein
MIITIIDTETTGFDMLKHEIIEIAAIKVMSKNNKFEPLGEYQAKVIPEHIEWAAPQALKINGYTEEGWANARPFSQVGPEFAKFINDSDIHLGQNLIFDHRFITKAYNQHNLEAPKFKKYFDTKLMADSLVHDKKLERSGLDFLCEHFKIKTTGRAHTALADCKRTLLLFDKLRKEIKPTVLEFNKPYDPHGGKDASKKEE